MWDKIGESRTTKSLERAMDASMLRAKLLNHNLANVNTPFYKRMDINFESAFNNELAKNDQLEMVRTHPLHLESPQSIPGAIKIDRETKTLSRYDTNNIDPEFEMAQVAQNTLFFQSITQTWKKKMSGIKMVIEGRA